MSTDDANSDKDELRSRSAKKIESNTLDRQRAFLRQRFAQLRSPDTPDVSFSIPAAMTPDAGTPGGSAPLPQAFHKNLMTSYRQRQSATVGDAGPSTSEAVENLSFEAPLPAPFNNWVPLGPSVLRQGQAVSRPAVSGRVAGIAVAPGGLRVYVASANGGVWRSDDGGKTWRSTMDAWDLNPTTESSDSLACGAIAIDLNDPDRVYVGTGEGGAESFYGVGPIRSDDGGTNWYTEPTATPETSLDGRGFYALAVDPANRDRVVGATEIGLYRREPNGSDGFHWVRKIEGVFTSVVVSRSNNVTTFYAAKQGGDVVMSNDGKVWKSAGVAFPTDDTWRIGLAVQPNNPNVLHALICRQYPSYHMRGVWRLDLSNSKWREVEGAPRYLFGDNLREGGQGWYDLAIAVDPNNMNRIYLGGSTADVDDIYPGSLYGCLISASGSGAGLKYRMVTRYMGAKVHADVHALEFTPGDSNKLWVGCDGGVFYTRDATGDATFVPRNLGLATLTMQYLAMHPTEEALIFCGTQDNGTVRFTGEEVWLHSCWGDGGFAVINWRNPRMILRTYTYGNINRATDGGQGYDSWSDASLPAPHDSRGEFYAPLVGALYNPAAAGEADIVAFGGVRLWLSTNFGSRWRSLPTNDVSVEDEDSKDALKQPDPALCELDNFFRSIAFASVNRIYAGTTMGEVYRYDKRGRRWSRTHIHASPLLTCGPVTSIAVDPADPGGESIYLTMGGHGDYRHVWHFDGRRWEHCSGPADDPDKRLLDVSHNSIVVDPDNPAHLFVAADIGVWRSTDSGKTWSTFSFGLPDAAVLDLKLHAPSRLLRAATHGRGVFEYSIDSLTSLPVELYLRDTQLDVARRAAESGLYDPTRPDGTVKLGDCPDIKIDVPSPGGGYQTATNQIDSWEFTDLIEDNRHRVAAVEESNGVVNNRIYVQVHNRGLTAANEVNLVVLLAKASGQIPDLPLDFVSKVQNGHTINTPEWQMVGMQTLNAIHVNLPRIAALDLPSSMLPSPGELAGNDDYALLAVLHSPGDPYTNNRLKVAALVSSERKATIKRIRLVPFEGALPPELHP